MPAHNPARGTPAPSRTPPAAAEPLERRLLYSATATLDDRELRITADTNGAAVTVQLDSAARNLEVRIADTTAGLAAAVPAFYSIAQVRRVEFVGNAGNDSFQFVNGGGGVIDLPLIGTGAGGDDVIVAGNGRNVLDGGDGNDQLTAGDGPNRIDAGTGNDLLISGGGADRLVGGGGDDVLIAGGGRDRLDGGDGNDLLVGGGGRDRVTAGAGDDEIDIDPRTSRRLGIPDDPSDDDPLVSGLPVIPFTDDKRDHLSAGAGNDIVEVSTTGEGQRRRIVDRFTLGGDTGDRVEDRVPTA